jgi:hypothetical protein
MIYMNAITKIYVTGLLLLVAIPFYGQEDIKVTPVDTIIYQGSKNEARVDFVSAFPALKFREYNGEATQAPQKREDGKYVYTCICHVENRNKFRFNITLPRTTTEMLLDVSIKEHQHYIYNVDIEAYATIEDVKMVNPNVIIPRENTSVVRVTTGYNKLIAESITGEKVDGPKLNDNNGTVIYEFAFDLSTPESRQIQRGLRFSVDGIDYKTIDLGTLSPRGGKDIAVIVLTGCYQSNISRAQESFLNGAYLEAYTIYKEIINTDKCEDKPSDLSEDKKQMNEAARLALDIKDAREYYEKAESFLEKNMVDSGLRYHEEAHNRRILVLKKNENDPYCLQYNRLYSETIAKSRFISGKVQDNGRLINGQNPPMEGCEIVLTLHKKKIKKKNGLLVPVPKKKAYSYEHVGTTAADGSFTVRIPWNPADRIYVLNFASKGGNKIFEILLDIRKYPVKYVPKDVPREKNLIMKYILPKK